MKSKYFFIKKTLFFRQFYKVNYKFIINLYFEKYFFY